MNRIENISFKLFYLSSLVTIVGIMLIDIARALPSIGMITMAISGIAYKLSSKKPLHEQNKWVYFSLTLCFIILLPSWFYSENKEYLYERWQISLPFLILPLVWLIAPQFRLKDLYALYAFFLTCVSLLALHAFFFYLFHADAVNELYLHSQVMPTLVTHHPTFSLMCAFGVLVGWTLYTESFSFESAVHKYIWLGMALFLFVFVHVYSVRIGLLVLYTSIIAYLGGIIIRQKKVWEGLLALVAVLALGISILLLSPTFSNKLANTSEDLKAMEENASANNKSLASRKISYLNAIQIAKESGWVFGSGLGDIRDLNNALFASKYPDVSKPIIPHNQFLYLLAAIGISGLLIFVLGWIYPAFYFGFNTSPLFWGIYLLMFFAFQFEAVLQTQLGVAFCLLFLLLGIRVAFLKSTPIEKLI